MSMLTDTHYDTIFTILENFDFDRVKEVMDFLDWKWYNGSNDTYSVPDIYRIKETARKYLCECAKRTLEYPSKEFTVMCAGFKAEGKLYDDGFLWLNLSFILEEFNNSE